MSTPLMAARSPQRERGEVRVAAIMEAAAALFREKGFDAVTMSDIAARSATAFGSLYRFFPSKEAVADALLRHYAQRTLDRLSELAEQAAAMTPDALADALVAFIRSLQLERSFVITVVEARGGSGDKRAAFRTTVREHLAVILRAAFPALSAADARVSATVTLHLLKGIAGAADEAPAMRRALGARYRDLLRAHFASLQGTL